MHLQICCQLKFLIEKSLQNNNSDSKEIQSCHSLHQDIFYYNALFDHFQGQLTKLLFRL